MFPDSEYIAQRGRGKTRGAAEANAAAEIARYITSQVNTRSGYRMTAVQINGQGAEKLDVFNEALVKTEIDLFGIRYADGAFYDPARKEWHAAAYIERDEAWQVYAPRIRTQSGAFLNLYNAAEKEDDPFKKFLRYEAARNYAQKTEYESAMLFGQILHPAKMDGEFADTRSAIAALPQKIDNAKRGAAIYIDCPVDFEGRVTTALSDCFTAQGFAAAKTRTQAAAVCSVTVTEGEQKRELGVFYHPSMNAVLSGKSGVLASFTAQGEQAQAVTPDVAKRRAYTSLADAIQAHFAAQFAAVNKTIL
jgi:hypothetical protein